MTRQRLIQELMVRFGQDFINYEIEQYPSPHCDIRLYNPISNITTLIRIIQQTPPLEEHLTVIVNEYMDMALLSDNQFKIDSYGHIYYH